MRTRRRFRMKYLLLQSTNTTEYVPSGRYYPIPSSTLHPDAVQELIITRQALPCTPDMDDIIYRMERWGRVVSIEWYRQVMSWLAFNMELGFAVDKENLLFECIEIRLRQLLSRAGLCLLAEFDIHRAATDHFHYIYKQQGTTDFFWLSLEMIRFVAARIEDHLLRPTTPPPVALPTPVTASSM